MFDFFLGFLVCLLVVVALVTYRLSWQGWVALDIFLSCRLDKRQSAKETYSSVCWRKRHDGPEWANRVIWIDRLFRLLGQGPNHCENSFITHHKEH